MNRYILILLLLCAITNTSFSQCWSFAPPISPTIHVSVDPVTFRWYKPTPPISGCNGVLVAANIPQFCPIVSQPYPPIVGGGTMTDTCNLLSNGSWTGNFAVNQTYCWATRVDGGPLTWSNVEGSNITRLQAALPYPNLILPSSGSSGISLTPLMRWETVNQASSYYLCLYKEKCCLTIAFDSTTNLDSLRIPGGKLMGNTTYYWRVKPYKTGGEGPFSDAFYFTTAAVPPPPPPVLVSPPNNSTVNTTTPLLDWDTIPAASTYQVQLSTDSIFSIVLIDLNGIVNTNTTVLPGILMPGTIYYWKVRGYNAGGAGPWSQTWHFTVAPIPAVPVLIAPPNNSTGNLLSVTLAWNNSPGASSYRVQTAFDSLFSSILLDDSTVVSTGRTVSGLSILTKYYWRVSAKGPTGTSQWSPVWNFKTMGTPTQVTLLLPPNNSINVPISFTFTWSKAYDQTAHLFVSNYWFERVTDTVSMSNLLRDTTLTDTTKAVTGMNNSTSYYWRVKAKNQIGWGNFAPWFKFTTVVAAPNAPTLISPINGAVGQSLTPRLDWSAIASAASYRIQLSGDSLFTGIILDSNVAADSIDVPSGLLANNTRYYWRVNASNAGGTSPWSQVWHFNTLLIGTGNYYYQLPKEFKLYSNYPNPFNPSTVIKIDIPKAAFVRLVIYDIKGQEVEVIINQQLNPGTYAAEFNGTNYPSGVYFYKLETETFVQTQKMVLIK